TATALSPVATAQPAPAATQPAPAATPNFQYGGVSFQYGPRIAAGLNAQSRPANPPSDKVAPWDVTPRSVQVDFTGYVLADIFHNPRIMVFPTEEYAKISPQAAQIIETLRQLLANKPERVTDVPFLPFWNAGQVFHTRLAYLDFKNGSGVRFLTEYSQNTPPISNYALFYSFQGLSADGRYYVSAILPVQNPILPDGRSLTQQDYETVNQDYEAYLADIAARLELEPAESFNPNLNDLDALVKSLDVK
ncbi:MAG TPA: hypothetical protein VF498_10480, partial [Anaerolineales bacterium]